MNQNDALRFSGEIILITSMLANRIKYLLHTERDNLSKVNTLLDVLSHFTLIPTVFDNEEGYHSLLVFQEKISTLPYSELDELKGCIAIILDKIAKPCS